MSSIQSHIEKLGEQDSVWFALTPLLKEPHNPMSPLMRMAQRYGSAVRLNIGEQRIVLLSEPEHFKHVLVTKADNYAKYFDGLKPVFGNSMITHDGALWQTIRTPQQPAFHPDMFATYVPYFIDSIEMKLAKWVEIARSGEAVEMVEEAWTLAADMVCKALFDREVPFNPHVIFKYVKTYTDVASHKDIRARKTSNEQFDTAGQDTAKAMAAWAEVPLQVLAADPKEARERTLLKLIEQAVVDPSIPEFDQAVAVDELKQYLWAGTETTALALAWSLYEVAKQPAIAARIRQEARATYAGRMPMASDYSALSYTRAVIQEAMRVYPPVWGLIRTALEPDEVGGVPIAAGDRVVAFVYGAHHNPAFWDHPQSFDPTRFLDSPPTKRKPYSYLPFGAGKRACIGGALSQVENTLALSLFLNRFELEYVGPEPPAMNATLTLTPRGGLMFKIRSMPTCTLVLP